MKIETEIKLILTNFAAKKIAKDIEKNFGHKKSIPFRQVTHQFFFENYSKQNVFPRIRNEEDGTNTLTVKIKPKKASAFFKRTELVTTVSSAKEVIKMMPFFGFPQKISWEKRRHSFFNKNGGKSDIHFSLDETPMGWILEIEAEEGVIKKALTKLGLEKTKKSNKSYLGLWEEYKKEHGIVANDMLFDNKK